MYACHITLVYSTDIAIQQYTTKHTEPLLQNLELTAGALQYPKKYPYDPVHELSKPTTCLSSKQ